MREPRTKPLANATKTAAWLTLGVLLSIAMWPAINARMIRAELPNGAYLHDIWFRTWDNNLVLRAPSGRLVVPPDVMRIKFSDTHVWIAQREKGQTHAQMFFVYDVAGDSLTECARRDSRKSDIPNCDKLLQNTGINREDAAILGTIGGWHDWAQLSSQNQPFTKTWYEKGNGSGFTRTLRERLN